MLHPNTGNEIGKEVDALRAELEDIKSGFRLVVNEVCFGDEKHCACVYPLRARVALLEKVAEAAENLRNADVIGERVLGELYAALDAAKEG